MTIDGRVLSLAYHFASKIATIDYIFTSRLIPHAHSAKTREQVRELSMTTSSENTVLTQKVGSHKCTGITCARLYSFCL